MPSSSCSSSLSLVNASDRSAGQPMLAQTIAVWMRGSLYLGRSCSCSIQSRWRCSPSRVKNGFFHGEPNSGDVLDRLQLGVLGEHQLDGERVVGVDQERHLLRPREGTERGRRHRRQIGQHGLQRGPVAGHARVGDTTLLLVGQPAHVLLQQRIPGRIAMVERLRRRIHHPRRGQQRQQQLTAIQWHRAEHGGCIRTWR